jgi:Fuc2NAc and GlcNAc transferase
MTTLVLLVVLSAVISWGAAVMVLRRAFRLSLVQLPNHRSSHIQPTPNGGGLGIVLGGTIAGIWLSWGQSLNLWTVIGLALPLAIVGLLDDIRHLPARVRFVVHVAVCGGLLIALGSVPAISLTPALLSGGSGVEVAGWFLSALLLLAGVWWINLFNFMDGIDGIAGAQAVFMLVAAASLAWWAHSGAMANPVWVLMLCVAAATIGFLLLNLPPARIFMGDVGSTWLAFMIFAFALFTIQTSWLSYAVWLVLAAVFVADTVVTLLTRMARGERWHEAHRSHAYQRLSRRWHGARHIGHRSVTLLVAAIDLLWLAPLAWACVRWPQWAQGFVMLAYMPLAAGVLLLGAGRPDNE